MSDVSADKTPADASQSGDTVFVAGKEYFISSRKEASTDPIPKVVTTDASTDIGVECPDVSSDKHYVPPKAASTQKDKGKSVMVDQEIPRKKSKQELANEKLSELVAAQWQAKEDAAKTKTDLDMKASEELARKIQADLDRMGTPITYTLPTERQRELDEIAKRLSAEQWATLATQVSAKPDLAKSVLGTDYHATDFAKRMVENVKLQKKAEAERKAKEMRDKPWTKGKIRNYIRNFVKVNG
jgi:hypothetical protein